MVEKFDEVLYLRLIVHHEGDNDLLTWHVPSAVRACRCRHRAWLAAETAEELFVGDIQWGLFDNKMLSVYSYEFLCHHCKLLSSFNVQIIVANNREECDCFMIKFPWPVNDSFDTVCNTTMLSNIRGWNVLGKLELERIRILPSSKMFLTGSIWNTTLAKNTRYLHTDLQLHGRLLWNMSHCQYKCEFFWFFQHLYVSWMQPLPSLQTPHVHLKKPNKKYLTYLL